MISIPAKCVCFMMSIIARQNEIALLEKINNAPEPAFVAVYGRRRVGKTHLIREFFSDKGFYFELSGMKGAHKVTIKKL